MSEPKDKIDISDLKETFLECPVCVEHFNQTDKRPRLLNSCRHTFCTQCLHQLLLKEGKGQITCPLCRQVQTITGDVDTLPMDLVRNKLVDYVHIEPKNRTLCSDCPDKNEAISWCFECSVNLCSECVQAHGRVRMTKDHRLTSLEEMVRDITIDNHICTVHKRNFELFCKSCDQLCCVSCIVIKHDGHELEPITEAAQSNICDWEERIKHVNDSIAHMRTVCRELEEETETLVSLKSKTTVSIEEEFERIFNQLKMKKEKMIEEVTQQSSQAVQNIAKQREVIEVKIATAESVADDFHQIKSSTSDCDVLLAAPTFQHSLDSLENQITFSVVSQVVCKFVPASSYTISQLVQTTGKIEYSKRQMRLKGTALKPQEMLSDQTRFQPIQSPEAEEEPQTVSTGRDASLSMTWDLSDDGKRFSFHLPGGIKVKIYQSNIVDAMTDGIVSAKTPEPNSSTRAATAIERACGTTMKKDYMKCVHMNGPLKVGKVMHTHAGDLQGTHYVLHTIGPAYQPAFGKDSEECSYLLTLTFSRCLHHARKRSRLQTLAFPFISTGVHGVPEGMCVKAFLDAVLMFCQAHPSDPRLTEIHLVNTDLEMVQTAIVMIQQHLDHDFDALVATALSSFNTEKEKQERNFKSLQNFCDEKPSSTATRHSSFRRHHPDDLDRLLGRQSLEQSSLQKEEDTTASLYPRRQGQYHVEEDSAWKRRSYAGPETTFSEQNAVNSGLHYGRDRFASLKDRHISRLTEFGKSSEQMSWTDPAPPLKLPYEHDSFDFPVRSKGAFASPSSSRMIRCSFCQMSVVSPLRLDGCRHVFCKECCSPVLISRSVCPVCYQTFRSVMGDQPSGGRMSHKISRHQLQGYLDADGVIVIEYVFSPGIQKSYHPNPGKTYGRTNRTAYLPNNEDGREVLGLLRKAFDARMIFTVGQSQTSGKCGVVTWTDIEHKTSLSGGPTKYGYPDPSYLTRVKQELADRGITD